MVNNREGQLDIIFQALSDQTRRAILWRLVAGECRVGELAEPFHMSLAAVSKHIKVLEDAKLVEKVKEGRTFLCRANFENLSDANALLEQLSSFWQGRLDALDQLLNDETTDGEQANASRAGTKHSEAGNKKSHSRKKR